MSTGSLEHYHWSVPLDPKSWSSGSRVYETSVGPYDPYFDGRVEEFFRESFAPIPSQTGSVPLRGKIFDHEIMEALLAGQTVEGPVGVTDMKERTWDLYGVRLIGTRVETEDE
jgi:hypothetical protein